MVVRYLSVHTWHPLSTEKVFLTARETAEDICIEVAKRLRISPLSRHLFALYSPQAKCYLATSNTFPNPESSLLHDDMRYTNAELSSIEVGKYEFELRFHVSPATKLQSLDSTAFLYFFHQVPSTFI